MATHAEQPAISTWDAASFRVWGFVPYWSGQHGVSLVNQLESLRAAGMYDHVSDVLYISGVRPNSTGGLVFGSGATQHLSTLRNHAAQEGFRLHMSMLETSGGSTDAVWTSIVSNPTYRANFVNNVTDLLNSYNMRGFNFDWERPNTVEKWGNYTQLARELGNVIRPLGMEISVDDYGFADSRWDDSPLFDARVYDQLFIMGYHYPAFSSNSLNNNSFANGKLALTGQGADKAFKNEQLVLGIGTWGAGGPATVPLKTFADANPNLAPDVLTISGTYTALNGNTYSGTWEVESRYQVREKTQLALDRNMPGMMSWTLHYDATNHLSLHRVMHHYIVFQRGIPDLNLDGQVNAADAHALADNMGTVPGWTGTNTAARFDNFYLRGNWEQGDRNGNGFVNQADADWLASRFAALNVTLPDRLAYAGTFENFANSRGLMGRWRAHREAAGNLRETGNYTQHGAGHLTWSGSGIGADKHSDFAVTMRNQNAAERFDGLNTLPRVMQADLAAPIDLVQQQETYFTFLVRQNTGPLLASQQTSLDRTLALAFLDSAGASQFEFTFRGLQQEFSIQSQADPAGQSATAGGFLPDTTFLVVGKIAGNGAGANTFQASLFANGAAVGNFADPNFPWALTAQSSPDFNPEITQAQFMSLYEANYTVSNVWLGTAADFFAVPSAAAGDFNVDGVVDMADYIVWRRTLGRTGDFLAADANGNGIIDDADLDAWRANFGQQIGNGSASSALSAAAPEPESLLVALFTTVCVWLMRRRRGPRGRHLSLAAWPVLAIGVTASWLTFVTAAPGYDLHFDYTSFETTFRQAQFDVLNYPSINGNYMMTSTDNHRPEMVANGNALAQFYNPFCCATGSDYLKNPRPTATEEADAIHAYTIKNSTKNGVRPDWLILNELSPSLWQQNPGDPSLSEFRTWVIDCVTRLTDVYGYKVIAYSPYQQLGTTANGPSWRALADKAYIAIEAYLDGNEVMAGGTDYNSRVAYAQSKYQAAKNSYLAVGIDAARLFVSEHFANNTRTTSTGGTVTWGRAGLASASDWDQVIMIRQDAIYNVGFDGFLAYNWGGNGMGVTQAEQIQHEYYYRSRLTLRSEKPQWLSDSAIDVNGWVVPLSWSQPLNWKGGVPNAPGAEANFWRTLTASRAITLDGNKTVGKMLFDSQFSYTINAGTGGGISFNNSATDATLTSSQGSHTINTPVQLASSLTATINAGTFTIGGALSGPGGLTKTGAGTLVLGGTAFHAGDTMVQSGRLTLARPALADAADVYLASGGTLQLNFSGSPDVIHSLFINGAPQPVGTWGALGSGAQFTSPLITGTGWLQVDSFGGMFAGDFDQNGLVDAADYIVWRTTDGTAESYAVWRANFGRSAGSGTGGLSAASSAALPEPSCAALLALAIAVGLIAPRANSR